MEELSNVTINLAWDQIRRNIEQSVRIECGVPKEYYMENNMRDAYRYHILGSLTESEQRCYESLEKGGNVMCKYLFHIILFNKDTEIIDFKEYISAKEASDAMMYAAQTYGKYNPNIHVVIVKKIENSQYEVEE